MALFWNFWQRCCYLSTAREVRCGGALDKRVASMPRVLSHCLSCIVYACMYNLIALMSLCECNASSAITLCLSRSRSPSCLVLIIFFFSFRLTPSRASKLVIDPRVIPTRSSGAGPRSHRSVAAACFLFSFPSSACSNAPRSRVFPKFITVFFFLCVFFPLGRYFTSLNVPGRFVWVWSVCFRIGLKKKCSSRVLCLWFRSLDWMWSVSF